MTKPAVAHRQLAYLVEQFGFRLRAQDQLIRRREHGIHTAHAGKGPIGLTNGRLVEHDSIEQVTSIHGDRAEAHCHVAQLAARESMPGFEQVLFTTPRAPQARHHLGARQRAQVRDLNVAQLATTAPVEDRGGGIRVTDRPVFGVHYQDGGRVPLKHLSVTDLRRCRLRRPARHPLLCDHQACPRTEWTRQLCRISMVTSITATRAPVSCRSFCRRFPDSTPVHRDRRA